MSAAIVALFAEHVRARAEPLGLKWLCAPAVERRFAETRGQDDSVRIWHWGAVGALDPREFAEALPRRQYVFESQDFDVARYPYVHAWMLTERDASGVQCTSYGIAVLQ